MWRISFFGIISGFYLWLFLGAAISSAMPVVKIKSEFHPDANAQKVEPRLGTAVLVKRDGVIYLLTSSHVVFHGDAKQGIRHSVTAQSGMAVDLTLESVNFGLGLALLRLKTSDELGLHRNALPFHKLKQLAQKLTKTSEKEAAFISQATLAGYRRRDLHLIKDAHASLLTPDAVMPVLPLVSRMLYVHGYSERGMSGGGLFSSDPTTGPTEFLGLISHHYFENKNGYDTRLKAYHGPRDASDVVTLVVPVTEIVPWIDDVFSQGVLPVDSDLRLDLEAQRQGGSAVALGKIRLDEHSCTGDAKNQDTTAIGGQGSGIGGGGRRRICAIRLRLAKQEVAPWPFDGSRAWHDDVAESLTSTSAAFVGNELYLTEMSDGIATEPVTDLVSTLAKINSGKYRFSLRASLPPGSITRPLIPSGADVHPVETIEIRSISYGGSGCPAGSVNSVVQEENEGFRLTYDSFVAEAGTGVSPRNRRKNCQVAINMLVPAGWSYTLARVKTRGYVDLEEGSSGLHKISFYFMGQRLESVGEKKFVGPLADDFETTAEFGLHTVAWSPCGAPRALNIATEARVVSPGKQHAVIATDTLEGTFSQEYSLRWRKCGDDSDPDA